MSLPIRIKTIPKDLDFSRPQSSSAPSLVRCSSPTHSIFLEAHHQLQQTTTQENLSNQSFQQPQQNKNRSRFQKHLRKPRSFDSYLDSNFNILPQAKSSCDNCVSIDSNMVLSNCSKGHGYINSEQSSSLFSTTLKILHRLLYAIRLFGFTEPIEYDSRRSSLLRIESPTYEMQEDELVEVYWTVEDEVFGKYNHEEEEEEEFLFIGHGKSPSSLPRFLH
ncbi:hypothetical protein G9A89_022201 [Geosiphon pyriformis]|nr:hypothetical protein G9A89_022201 [Geosiphon pyriformis]